LEFCWECHGIGVFGIGEVIVFCCRGDETDQELAGHDKLKLVSDWRELGSRGRGDHT
jgi:hypothetical protein